MVFIKFVCNIDCNSNQIYSKLFFFKLNNIESDDSQSKRFQKKPIYQLPAKKGAEALKNKTIITSKIKRQMTM